MVILSHGYHKSLQMNEEDDMLKKGYIKSSKFLCHIMASLAALFIGCLILYCVRALSNGYFTTNEAIMFLVSFVVLSMCLLLVLWKFKPFFWYFMIVIVAVVVLCAFWCYHSVITTDDNFENYLKEETGFNVVARMALPPRDTLKQSDDRDVEYVYTKKNDGFEAIELRIMCTEENYLQTCGNLEDNITANIGNIQSKVQYIADAVCNLRQHSFNGYSFCIDGIYYALIYNACSDANTITILFFTNSELAFMNVQDALNNSSYA